MKRGRGSRLPEQSPEEFHARQQREQESYRAEKEVLDRNTYAKHDRTVEGYREQRRELYRAWKDGLLSDDEFDRRDDALRALIDRATS